MPAIHANTVAAMTDMSPISASKLQLLTRTGVAPRTSEPVSTGALRCSLLKFLLSGFGCKRITLPSLCEL